MINELYVDDKVKDYIVDIVWRPGIRMPTGSASRLHPALGRVRAPRLPSLWRPRPMPSSADGVYVTPQDVKSIGLDVLRHRVTLTYGAGGRGEDRGGRGAADFDELPVP